MGHPDDSGFGEQPERFDEATGPFGNVSPVPKHSAVARLARAMQTGNTEQIAAALEDATGANVTPTEHDRAAAKLMADVQRTPPSSKDARGATDGHVPLASFDSRLFISKFHGGRRLLESLDSVDRPTVLALVEQAYLQGCMDKNDEYRARLDRIMWGGE